jgi:acetyl-CoA acetyltransferase
MIRGQIALRDAGLRGGPILNVESACASGSLAAHLAWSAVASGAADVSIAVGAEKLIHPDKTVSFAAIEAGTDLPADADVARDGGSIMMGAYAAEARAYAERHGRAVEPALAQVAVKNRAAAALNPNAQFREPISADDVAASRLVADPLRLLTCSPLTDGAAALVFRAADERPAPVIRASVVRSFEDGQRVVQRAARDAYGQTGLSAADMDLLQLHDASAYAELAQYEQIGLVGPGEALELVLSGAAGLRGRHPTNTDGGLLSRGHALGATGLAQIAELVIQLRGAAGERQVAGAKRGMAVNSGGWMGSDYAAGVVTIVDA